MWGPGLMKSPSHCSHCAPLADSVPKRGVWSCACWLIGTGRAPAKETGQGLGPAYSDDVHINAIAYLLHVLVWYF